MRHTLVVVSQDYAVERSEDRAIAAAVASIPERTELRDVTLPPQDLAQAVTSVLQTLRHYREALLVRGAAREG